MRENPLQQVWSTIFIVMVVLVPAILYMQLVVESANDKQMQILLSIRDTGNSIAKMAQEGLIHGDYFTEYLKGVIRSDNNIQNKVTESPIMNLEEEGEQIAKCVTARGERQCWREIKRKVWITGLKEIERMPEISLSKFETPSKWWEAFDLVTPTHECDLNHFSRVGEGDGGKWVCGPLPVNDNKCAIFSLGCNGQFNFEKAMQKYTKGKCQMYTFDCTGTWQDPSTIFFPWCIAGSDYIADNGKIYKRISTIVRELGLKEISYLKMDIEGYEWAVFNDILKPENEFALPRQISFELHAGSPVNPRVPKEFFKENSKNWVYPMIKLLRMIDGAGYRFAAAEKNPYCGFCYEYVIVRQDVLD